MKENPRFLKKDIVLAEVVRPGDLIQIYPADLPDGDSYRATVVRKIVIEFGSGSKRDFVSEFKEASVVVKTNRGGKNLAIGRGTAVEILGSSKSPLEEVVRFRGGRRITKLRLD